MKYTTIKSYGERYNGQPILIERLTKEQIQNGQRPRIRCNNSKCKFCKKRRWFNEIERYAEKHELEYNTNENMN